MKCKVCGVSLHESSIFCHQCGSGHGSNSQIKPEQKRWAHWVAVGCLVPVILFFGFLFIVALIPKDPARDSPPSPPPSLRVYKMGETVVVGYTAYAVWDAQWRRRLSDNPYLNEPPDASYLFVELAVMNRDRQARTIPPFKLVDEVGREHDTSAKAWRAQRSIGPLEELNPGVTKQGVVVFDVPRNHKYRLKVSGGYWSSDSGLIELTPK